jgi:hypothetical protein
MAERFDTERRQYPALKEPCGRRTRGDGGVSAFAGT